MKVKFRRLTLAIIALIMVVFSGCAGKSEVKNTNINFKYAKGFDIKYIANNCKLITDSAGKKFLLVPKGKKAPSGYDDAKVINTPVSKVAAFSTTYVSALRSIGEVKSVVAVTTPKDKWYIDEVKKGLDSGTIKYVGNQSSPNYEEIKALSPDIAILHTGSGSQDKQIAKLEALGIPCITYNEHMQNDPLAKVEEIRVLAAFYDKDDVALENFERIEKNIKAVSEKVKDEKKPKVAYGYIFKGLVYVPNQGSYVSKMIEIAGGDYMFKDIGKNQDAYSKISIEEFYVRAKNADVLIYDNTSDISVKSLGDIVKNTNILKDIEPIKSNNVWGIKSWYWQDTDKMDVIIKDMSAVIYPDKYPDYKFNYYYKLK